MLAVRQIYIWMSKWKNDRQCTIGVTHSRITQFNTADKTLVPKTFYEGDELFVDGSTNRVYINCMRDDSYRIVGSSQVFDVEPGKTDIAAVSDGSFTASADIRRRYV